jgi:hypothetical protein
MQTAANLIKTKLVALSCALLLAAFGAGAWAADAERPAVTVFTNVKVFNGSDDKLIDADVLIEGNMIKQVGKNLSADGATVIDGGGRPGVGGGRPHADARHGQHARASSAEPVVRLPVDVSLLG